MLQILTNTTQRFKIITLLFAGLAASSLHPAFASRTEDRAAATKDAVAYYAAVEDLKSDYEDKQAYDNALHALALDLAAEQDDLFEVPAKAKVFNTDFELIYEFAPQGEDLANDEDKLMVYNNTTYYIQ